MGWRKQLTGCNFLSYLPLSLWIHSAVTTNTQQSIGVATAQRCGSPLFGLQHALVRSFLRKCFSASCSTCSPSCLYPLLHLLALTPSTHKLLHSYFSLLLSPVLSHFLHSPFLQSALLFFPPPLNTSPLSASSPPLSAPSLCSILAPSTSSALLPKQLLSFPPSSPLPQSFTPHFN